MKEKFGHLLYAILTFRLAHFHIRGFKIKFKRIQTKLLLIFLLGLFDYVAIAEDMSLHVGLEQAGVVKIGDEAQNVYRLFPKERRKLVDLELEGSLAPALALKLEGSTIERGIVAELLPRNNKLIVWRIRVYDPAMKTAEGIGVGSTMKDLRTKYTVKWVGSGEGAVYAGVESIGASFELDPDRFYELFSNRDPDKVPDDVEIVGILLWSR